MENLPSSPSKSAAAEPQDGEHADTVLLEDLPAQGGSSAMPTIGQIGRYALKYRIGAGGLGTVYAADDPLLSRRVAIKTLNLMPAGSSTPLETAGREPFNEMFLHEARASAQLSHPHIVTVFDAGISPQGAYITMELLKGKDLRELLAEGWRPSAGQAALIIRRAADALAYAHSRGVVHRDVKPANIFMVGRTQPKLLDFGIASIAHAADSGAAGGSPHYMAPEQVRSEATDRRTDVFSLGVVLYELLCGQRAFDGDSLEAITRAVREHQPPAARSLVPAVPQALSDIAARAISKRPEDRQRSARVLARELHEWLQATPEALQSGEDEGLPVALGRGRAGLFAAAMGGIALAGIGAWYAMTASPGGSASAAGGSAAPVGAVPARSPAPTTTATTATALPSSAGTAAATVTPPPDAASGASAEVLAAPATANTAAVNEPAAGLAAPGIAAAPSAAPQAEAEATTGFLQLAVSPWAEVEVDGRVVGITPPLRQLSLAPGRHTVRLRNGAFSPIVRTIEVAADETATIRHRFGP